METTDQIKLIGILTNHRIFGTIIMPYFTTINEYGFPEISEPANSKNITKLPECSEVEKKFVTLAERFAENKIYKLFSKEKTLANFFKKLTPETLNDTIRPYIEDTIYQMLLCMRKGEIPFYTKQKGKFDIYESDRIYITEAFAEPTFHFIKEEGELRYHISCSLPNETVDLTQPNISILTIPTCSLLIGNKLILFKDIDAKKLKPFFTKKFVTIPVASEESYIKSFVIPCAKKYKVEIKGLNILL